ncbi:MAG: hypothetical protein QOF10_2502, partial [Kribbellaceae bacterium]|nr:hypothetical protein [Kribbellaceae bacterium]
TRPPVRTPRADPPVRTPPADPPTPPHSPARPAAAANSSLLDSPSLLDFPDRPAQVGPVDRRVEPGSRTNPASRAGKCRRPGGSSRGVRRGRRVGPGSAEGRAGRAGKCERAGRRGECGRAGESGRGETGKRGPGPRRPGAAGCRDLGHRLGALRSGRFVSEVRLADPRFAKAEVRSQLLRIWRAFFGSGRRAQVSCAVEVVVLEAREDVDVVVPRVLVAGWFVVLAR